MKELLKLTSIAEALRKLDEVFRPELKVETAGLYEAGGRFLARDITAREDVPGFNRSTKDGFAVRSGDTAGSGPSLPALLKVTGEILMGQEAGQELLQGSAVRIATGGMLPPGADAVLMLEYSEEMPGGEILVKQEVSPGENVLLQGEDVKKGQLLASAGSRIRPQETGVFASQGITEIPVYEPYRVGIISTGDEVLPVESPPGPGQVRDVNSYILYGKVKETGAVAVPYGICPDEYKLLKQRIEQALENNHMVLVSGGSSVGTRDYCVGVLEELSGSPPLFHGLPVKPGKPALGAAVNGKVVLGLPGHPVSAVNVFQLLARPLLEGTGSRFPGQGNLRAVLTRNVPSQVGRQDHIRVRLEKDYEKWRAVPLLGLSGMVTMLTEGDGEIIIPQAREGLLEGTEVDVNIY